MAIATRIPVGELKVANTSNVKEMKAGRPQTIMFTAEQAGVQGGLGNCQIVELGATMEAKGKEELDHVHGVTVKALADVKPGDYVVVAPEIMVEEARLTDGHIGKFRFAEDETYTAYELSLHDRLELSAAYFAGGKAPAVGTKVGDFKVISVRTIASGVVVQPNGQLYEASKLEMVKIELLPAAE